MFGRYHYLNHSISKTATQYVGFYNDKPIFFTSLINFPGKGITNRKFHRTVCLPDYQGIGIGLRAKNLVCEHENKKNDYITTVTSHKAWAKSHMRNKNWSLVHCGHITSQGMATLKKTQSSSRNTYSFRYIGNKDT